MHNSGHQIFEAALKVLGITPSIIREKGRETVQTKNKRLVVGAVREMSYPTMGWNEIALLMGRKHDSSALGQYAAFMKFPLMDRVQWMMRVRRHL